jgi:hypothetical protein
MSLFEKAAAFGVKFEVALAQRAACEKLTAIIAKRPPRVD